MATGVRMDAASRNEETASPVSGTLAGNAREVTVLHPALRRGWKCSVAVSALSTPISRVVVGEGDDTAHEQGTPAHRSRDRQRLGRDGQFDEVSLQGETEG